METEVGGPNMTDDMNQSKRKPWTTDPDVVKQIWGENAQAAMGTKTAVDRLVNGGGSIWPTDKELAAYGANALPDSQTFTRAPLSQASDIVKPAQHTPIIPTLVRKIDSTQAMVDSALGLKEAKAKKAVDIQITDEGEEMEEEDEDEEAPPPEAGRNPEEKSKKGKGKGKGTTHKGMSSPNLEIYIPVTPIETRMKEARIRMQEVIDRDRNRR